MMNDIKENHMRHLSCKSHTARTEKDLYRICPSKLSKRELEDLYFALLEQNVQLKKTINDQREQIKVLNTRVQRMTVQKPMGGFHNKDCCAGSKAIINEQKESIADLKKANERLSERLRLLNMRLCSAKQFLRRGSSQASYCSKCLVSSVSIKNSSMSALNTKRSDGKLEINSSPSEIVKDHIKIQLADIAVPTPIPDISIPTHMADNSIPTQIADISIPTQMAEVTSSQAEIPVQDAPCQRDECRTEIDELKLKIIALEVEVCHVRQSHSERMRSLEAAHAQCGSRAARRAVDLRDSRQQTDELSTQLQLHRARMSELNARRRDDDVTDRLDRATACLTNRTLPLADPRISDPPDPDRSEWGRCPPIVPNNSGISIFIEEKCHKNSNDSGFTDCKNQDLGQEKERNLPKRDLIENEIANVQSPLVYLKVNAGTEAEQSGVALGAESSLSHDIFSTSRLKTLTEFDKVPSTSHEPEFLVSMDQITDEDTHRLEKTNKYGPEFRYNIPGPLSLEMPRICLGDTGTDIKTVENEATITNSESNKYSEESVKINSDKIKQKKQELVDGDKNIIIDSLDKSNLIIQEIIEEGKTNNPYKKNRRSSLKSPYEGKQSRDLAVRYGETQTYKSSAKPEMTAKNVCQGTDIDKVYIEPDDDHESDPSVQYKVNERLSIRRIRYMNDVQTDPYMAPEQKNPGSNRADNVTRRDGTDTVENDVGIQCLRDLTPDGSCEAEQMVSYVPNDSVIKETIANLDPNNPVLCAGFARVCECPPSPAPRRMSLRTCAGTPAPAPPGQYRACACGHYLPPPHSTLEPRHSTPEPPHSLPHPNHSSPESRHSLPHPYHSSSKTRYSTPNEPGISQEDHTSTPEPGLSSPETRLATPDRTDCEVSSLTDLTRTHDASTSEHISPGEEKPASRLSESFVTTDCSLSEGEMPGAAGKRLSAAVDKMTEPVWGSRSNKMEEALRAISEELTRCRELLQGRAEEVSPRSSETPSCGRGAPPLALRRADGACRMRDSYTPKCIFTLHVGTVVLADQAAAAARGRCLQASWRLYRQAASSTRPLRGRVFNYDCTMHYDLKVTEHFLYYLKHEEMPIVITEMDKQDEVFATCALPLRDTLLHPNRRVDMSLALVPSGGGEEAGVLDVWCSLRVDAAALPAINTAIVRPSSLKSQHHSSSMLEQILDDDQSADYRFSRDLHLRRSKGASEDTQSCHNETLDKVPELMRSYNEVIENEVPSNIRSVNDFKQAVAKKSNDSTNIYEMLKNKKWNRRSTQGSQKAQEGGRQKSVTICNQASCSSIDRRNLSQTTLDPSAEVNHQSLDITILWLALNEDCRAMSDPSVKRLYVAYSFLGRSGADLETPISLPKPKHYMDKCHFLYKKTFLVSECEMLSLGRLACCVPTAGAPDPTRAVVFSVVSEPADDPLGLYSCEDIGYAYLYLGEVLSRSSGASHTTVLEVKDERGAGCGALAVRLDGLALLRRCRERAGLPVSTRRRRLVGLMLVRRYRESAGLLVRTGNLNSHSKLSLVFDLRGPPIKLLY